MLNEAQIIKLDDLLKYYDKYFYVIHERELEGYKWEAINKFQTEKDKNFLRALKLAFEEGANLLYTTNRDTLFKLIDNYPYDMNKLFLNLIDDNKDDLESRIKTFLYETEKLINREANRKWQKLLACDAMTCLAIIKPDEYFLYRPFVFKATYKYLKDIEYPQDAIKKAYSFHNLCKDILEYVSKKDVFLVRYHSFLSQNKNLYADRNNHLLVQNILYLLQYYPDPIVSDYKLICINELLTGNEFNESRKNGHTARTYDLEKELKENENRRRIGEQGESLVYEELLRQNKNNMELNHISKEDNYSPYDIKYDKTYIEVKTFSYQKKKNPSFYISQEEVKFSIKKAENYQLWFVIVDRNKKHWWYKIFDGDIRKSINLEYSKHGNKYYYKFNEEQLKDSYSENFTVE